MSESCEYRFAGVGCCEDKAACAQARILDETGSALEEKLDEALERLERVESALQRIEDALDPYEAHKRLCREMW